MENKIVRNLFAFSLLICFGLCSCSTPVQQVRPEIQPIVLKEAQTRHLAQGGTVAVPVGVYVPDFETGEGIYYRAQGHLIHKIIGITQLMRGGIFVPNPPTEKEKAQAETYNASLKKLAGATQAERSMLKPPRDFVDEGVWFDQQEQSGGLLMSAATSPKRIFRVTEPFTYDIQKAQP